MSPDAVQPVRSATIEHQELVVDGVNVHYFPSAEPTSRVRLAFGVGTREETLPTLGTLHALEHLVLHAVRRTSIEINGSVDPNTTEFTASGSPALVASFLEGVCRGLADPATARMSTEGQVLEAEDTDGDDGSPLALARFGWRDLGVCGGPGPGPRGVRAEEVRAMAARWFVASNAVLIVDGAWPEGLRLPLPGGPVPGRQQVIPRRWHQPHVMTVDGPACAASLVLPRAPRHGLELVAVSVIEDRVMEVLRHERGLTYDVVVSLFPTADQSWAVFIETDPRPERIVEAIRSLVEVTGRLLLDGPTAAEVEFAKERLIESSRGRDAEIATLVDAAIGALRGTGIDPFVAEAVAGITRADLTAYLAGIAQDVLFLADETAEPDLVQMGLPLFEGEPAVPVTLPDGETFRPPALALALSGDARATRVVLCDTGLASRSRDLVQLIPWQEVAGVMRDEDGDIVVFGRDGSAIPVGPGLYRRGRRLVDAVLATVPDALIYDAPAHLDAAGPKPAND